tara:strand:- start:291 stop:545 length:255 start_codon:yes stop_codon:yes gene_type:complete
MVIMDTIHCMDISRNRRKRIKNNMSEIILKVAIETILIVFSSLGFVFTCLAFYKGGVLSLDWNKLTEDFKREEPEEVKIKVKED